MVIIVKGGQKNLTKMGRNFCLISLATNMLEGWDIINLKGGKNFSVQYQGGEI